MKNKRFISLLDKVLFMEILSRPKKIRRKNYLIWNVQSLAFGSMLFARKGWTAPIVQFFIFAFFATATTLLMLGGIQIRMQNQLDWQMWGVLIVFFGGCLFFLTLAIRGIPPAMMTSVVFCASERTVRVSYLCVFNQQINEWPNAIVLDCYPGYKVWASIEFKFSSVVIPLLAIEGFRTEQDGFRYVSSVLRPLGKKLGVKICLKEYQ